MSCGDKILEFQGRAFCLVFGDSVVQRFSGKKRGQVQFFDFQFSTVVVSFAARVLGFAARWLV